jgi:site-specific recombinase XerC
VQTVYSYLRTIGTPLALRDEIAWRLGNLGMRAAEIRHLQICNVRPNGMIEWMGKRNKPRKVRTGPAFQAAWTEWLSMYPNPTPESPAVCTSAAAATTGGPLGKFSGTSRSATRTYTRSTRNAASKPESDE